MIEISDETLEQWEREYEEKRKKGFVDATDDEVKEAYDEAMKEIEAELEEWAEKVMNEPHEPDEWEKRYEAAKTEEERNMIWNERYGDTLYRCLPEDIVK